MLASLSAGPTAPQDVSTATTQGQAYAAESNNLPPGNSYQMARLALITRIVTDLRQLDGPGQARLIVAYRNAGGDPGIIETAIRNVSIPGSTTSSGSWRPWAVLGGVVLFGAGMVYLLRRREAVVITRTIHSEPVMSGYRRKSMATFIRENRAEIDRAIKSVCSNCRLNDRERRQWIMNDEGLYRWARSDGVNV